MNCDDCHRDAGYLLFAVKTRMRGVTKKVCSLCVMHHENQKDRVGQVRP